jgi:hypothetical protein
VRLVVVIAVATLLLAGAGYFALYGPQDMGAFRTAGSGFHLPVKGVGRQVEKRWQKLGN